MAMSDRLDPPSRPEATPRASAARPGSSGAGRRALRRVSQGVAGARRVGAAGPLALAAAVLPPAGAVLLLGQLQAIAPSLRGNAAGPLLCALAFSLLGGFALLPTYALSIFAGWCFGLGGGFATSMAGFLGATALGHWVAGRASGRRVADLLERSAEWRGVYGALLRGGFGRTVLVVALLRLLPVPPFSVTNVLLASAQVRRTPFVVGSLVGMVPSCLAVVSIAAGMERLNFDAGARPWVLGGALAATVVALGALAQIARRALRQVTARPGI